MIFDVKDGLSELGVPANKIHFELFTTEGLKRTSVSNDLSEKEREIESDVTIQMDGDLFEFSLEYGGQNILDAALAAGADLPYACKGGVCCTCKAKITEGEVVMDLNYALEPDEVAAGYVLLCQSHPRTATIYVDFDQK
jgi:ring-1,2-phenylacetyl-CoA epoxidase subunit PaaE